MDFFVRDANSLIPVEIKSNDNATASLNNLLKKQEKVSLYEFTLLVIDF